MNWLSYLCIYAIGFLLTYKYVLSFYLENGEFFNQAWARQAASLTCATLWPIFWPATFFIPVSDED